MIRTDRQIALLLFAFALALYLRTLAPDMLPGDAGEFQFAAWRWGLAHPTGYPLYLLLGGAWQHLLSLAGLTPAWALNAYSALNGSLAVVLLFILMRNWLPGSEPLRRAAALFTAALFAVNPTFWSQSLIAEVYTLHVLLLLLIFYLMQKLERQGDRETGRPRGGYPLGAGDKEQDDTHHASRNLPLVTLSPCHLVILSLLVGLSLTHHAMTLLLLPSLVVTVWLLDRRLWRSPMTLIGMVVAAGLPLLLYLYIPLRSGPDASPWYHQRLGDGSLPLYANTWPAFWAFISGRSISVGFYDPPQALANLAQAGLLWRLHFTWPGLALALFGLVTILRQRNWPLLALTLSYAVIQQVFNLFYAIGDILVYYIPLYLMAAIWAGFGVNALGHGIWNTQHAPRNTQHATRNTAPNPIGLFFILVCFLLPSWLLRSYYPRLDQSTATGARQMWNETLAAQPPADAILVSNDRNEIVPLFYLQNVEGRGAGMTGLFPLIKPGSAFTDIGATVETALAQGGDQPVYLIKPMPGLEVKFALEPRLVDSRPLLVQVMGLAGGDTPMHRHDESFGPLRLLGYDWQPLTATLQIKLYWSVQEQLTADYTTTVQLFDVAGEKIAQDDRAPGGVYYPTSLWKPGETLVDTHTIPLPADPRPATMLIGMYMGPEFTQLAPPLRVELLNE